MFTTSIKSIFERKRQTNQWEREREKGVGKWQPTWAIEKKQRDVNVTQIAANSVNDQ